MLVQKDAVTEKNRCDMLIYCSPFHIARKHVLYCIPSEQKCISIFWPTQSELWAHCTINHTGLCIIGGRSGPIHLEGPLWVK